MVAPRPFLALLVLLLLLTACGEDPPLTANEQAVLTCNETCAERGQCGTLTDGRLAVLGGAVFPAVKNHDRFFVDQTPVTVMEVQQHEVIAAREGVPLLPPESTPFFHTFYLVNDGGKTAWLSSWCAARP